MTPTLQTFFGLTMPASKFPIAPEMARALAQRITSAARALQGNVPILVASDLRRDAERYLAARRTRALRLPAALESKCDDHAWALMRLTANTPPQHHSAERLVA